MIQRKISISKKFIKKGQPASLVLLLEALYICQDYKLTLDQYNELCLTYIPFNKDQVLLNGPFRNLFRINNNEVIIDKDRLKDFGVYVKDTVIAEVELSVEEINKVMLAYNEVRCIFYKKHEDETKKTYMVPIQLKPSDRPVIRKLLDILKDKQIDDVFLYFYTIFNSSNWKIVWSLRNCISQKAIDIYYSNVKNCSIEVESRRKELENAENEKISMANGTAKCFWLHTYDYLEDKKKYLLDNNKIINCFDDVSVFGGYNPMSNVCTVCSMKNACAEKITNIFRKISKSNINILQLRAGMLPFSEAVQSIKNCGSDFDFYS